MSAGADAYPAMQVVGAVFASAAVLCLIFVAINPDEASVWVGLSILLLGPPALGCVAALSARGRANGLWIGFSSLLLLWLVAMISNVIWDSDNLALDVAIDIWSLFTATLAMCAVAGVWWIVRRLRRRPGVEAASSA